VRATLAAHGSSVERSLVTSTQFSVEFMLSTMYLVVTVPMNDYQIDISVVVMLSVKVMYLD
jgi:hypothetical protein